MRGTPSISSPGGAGFRIARGGGSVIVNADGTVSIVGDTDITGALSLSGNLDMSAGGFDILMGDNLGAALEFKEGANLYIRIVTTNGSEQIIFNQDLSAVTASFSGPSSFLNTLAVTGVITPSSDIDFSGQASPKIIMGTAGLLFRDDADATTHGSFDGAGKFSLTDALDVIGIVSIAGGGANGAKENIKVASIELTGLTGASVTAASLIPAGSFIVGVTIRVTTTITGATTFDIGDGTDVDRWGAAILLPAGTTTTIVDFTAAGFGQFAAANDVVLTANVANFTAGAVRITVHYADLTPATS